MYVVDVYMHHENTATVGDAAAASTKPDYQRECRFSEFCVLRQRLIETIAQPPLREGTSRRGWCLHCYRLDTLVVCGSFPTRYVAPQLMRVTMIKGMVIKHRQAVITDFLQRLVQSFTGNGPAHRGNICTRFLDSSSIFKDFVFG
ncbi:TPA: hypothetical protein N0F65_002730 [Lagenidium giganteum]|uniref:PX domain-containing protein n=1 Tax=Lagenidium giganteum TaxID=4803 RepID=A0AAV2Z1F3_9STRA|nr:TPA: hypothetical protein N0F65_002730 [Lagenidium giganteum]